MSLSKNTEIYQYTVKLYYKYKSNIGTVLLHPENSSSMAIPTKLFMLIQCLAENSIFVF